MEIDELFDRKQVRRIAEGEMLDVDPKRERTPAKIPTPELVRTMRQLEYVGRELHRDGELSEDFAMGIWTAMAAIRYDFAIEDAAHVDTERNK
jgi:hypothetical protein